MAKPVNINLYPESGRPSQLDLFIDVPRDPVPLLKSAMSESIKSCSLSREQIVDSMNLMMSRAGVTTNGRNQGVTLAVLDKWCAPSAREHVIPLRVLPFFCRAAGSNLALEAYSLAYDGIEIISADRSKTLAWAEAEIDLKRARARARKLAEEVQL